MRYDYLAKFGFGAQTGIELPGESTGILHPVDDWDGRDEVRRAVRPGGRR